MSHTDALSEHRLALEAHDALVQVDKLNPIKDLRDLGQWKI